jgi:hypothetical protein
MPEDTPLKDSAALLWTESQRQITRQEADLDGLRNRAVAMLSVASIVAALFGTRIATESHSARATIASVLALVFFGIGVMLSLVILAPKKSWAFTENLQKYFDLFKAGTLNPASVSSSLAENFEASRKENKVRIEDLYCKFLWVCVLVGLQVVAWAIAAI